MSESQSMPDRYGPNAFTQEEMVNNDTYAINRGSTFKPSMRSLSDTGTHDLDNSLIEQRKSVNEANKMIRSSRDGGEFLKGH